MPLFKNNSGSLAPVVQKNFLTEKSLQSLLENNLETVFNCRLVATEFSTGPQHSGRIDTLALSEDDNPVIIEYKKSQSSELITQSLYYFHWLDGHRGDFELSARKTLGQKIVVDWSAIRVICIAPNFAKYDIHAAQVVGEYMELWQYRLYENGAFQLEELLGRSLIANNPAIEKEKNPVMVAAGKKAALTRVSGSYSFDEHLEGKPENIKELAHAVRDFLLKLDPSIQEVPKKMYVAYKTSQNIACVAILKKSIVLYLKLDPSKVANMPTVARDVRNIGHWGTGDLEVDVKSMSDFEFAKPLIEGAYLNVGS